MSYDSVAPFEDFSVRTSRDDFGVYRRRSFLSVSTKAS